MNPLLRMIGMYGWGKGIGERYGGSETSDLKSLTDALAAYKRGAASGDQFLNNKSEDNSPPQQSPMDRIKAAFESLKDMHKGPNQTPENISMLAGPNSPSPFDNAHWPQGPVGAPSQAQAPMPQSLPMPQPRPAEAPQPQPENPMMSLFQRSAAMERDPLTGEFIDPQAGAKANAQPGIFHSLFS